MTTKRPVLLTVAAICLSVLVLFSAGLSLGRSFGLLGGGFGPGGYTGRRDPGSFQPGNFPQGNFPQGGFDNGTGQQPGNSSNPGGQGFPAQTGMAGLFRILRWVGAGLNITALVLGLLAAVGTWRQKKWGAVLAIVLASLLLLTSLGGLFRFFSLLSFGESLLKVLLAGAVIVLLLLPDARKAYAPPPPEPEL